MDETKYLISLLHNNEDFFHLSNKYWISYETYHDKWHDRLPVEATLANLHITNEKNKILGRLNSQSYLIT